MFAKLARSAGAVMCGGVYGCAVLSNYRVIELGMWVAGPAAGGLLADWGAEVIKVETPIGDPMRRLFAVTTARSPSFASDAAQSRSTATSGVQALQF